jgi:uncharacterized protein YbaR (Trm112 family)
MYNVLNSRRTILACPACNTALVIGPIRSADGKHVETFTIACPNCGVDASLDTGELADALTDHVMQEFYKH